MLALDTGVRLAVAVFDEAMHPGSILGIGAVITLAPVIAPAVWNILADPLPAHFGIIADRPAYTDLIVLAGLTAQTTTSVVSTQMVIAVRLAFTLAVNALSISACAASFSAAVVPAFAVGAVGDACTCAIRAFTEEAGSTPASASIIAAFLVVAVRRAYIFRDVTNNNIPCRIVDG